MPRPPLAADLKVGHTIRTARKKLGVLQEEVAAAVGVSPRALRSYESGEQSIPADRLPHLAHALRLPLADLGVVEPVVTAPPASVLSPDEAAWLALYHRLPTWARALFRRCSASTPVTPAQEHAPC